ncbi:hypothetical protein RRG08_043332 [Elysia crispata]|uniref:Uncharacterized protein n=1 Tax=Elysia crispata TaxID=231223 RepID=A0AAE1ED38_9GAST|nr:hypothetical protein RRG08_043332 [Elysia crispata]
MAQSVDRPTETLLAESSVEKGPKQQRSADTTYHSQISQPRLTPASDNSISPNFSRRLIQIKIPGSISSRIRPSAGLRYE